MQSKEQIFEAVMAAYKGLDDKFGQNITVLDISEVSPLADYFMIATGMNPMQTEAMAEACKAECANAGLLLNRTEGRGTGWLLLDFGAVIVHIFDKEMRQFYDLERIWSDAKNIGMLPRGAQ